MLKYLAQLSDVFGPLRVFDSLTFRSMLGLATGFLLAVFLGKRFIQWMHHRSATEDVSKPDSDTLQRLHSVKQGTPTMGGLVIVFTMLVGMALLCDLANSLVLVGMGVLLSFGLLGFVDDYWKMKGKGKQGLTKRQKLVVQTVLAGFAAYAVMLYAPQETVSKLLIPFTQWKSVQPDLGWLYVAFFVFVVVACTNAVNFTDGLDGLASGNVVYVAFTYGVFAYVAGNQRICDYFLIPHVTGCGELAVYCSVMIGAVMGFLWFNAHPAEVFMGDTGSLALGAAIAYVALVVKQELVLLVAGGVFVFEALSVVLQITSFRLRGKRIFKCAPFHHHLEFCGWHENKVVIRLWIIGAILAAAGLATLKMH